MPVEQDIRWLEFAGATALRHAARQRVIGAALCSIAEQGSFSIVLAGGNTPRVLYESLRDADTEWSRWEIWFGDERCAPADDPQRNSAMARAALLDHVPIAPDRIHFIPAENGADAAARAYADALRDVGDFDFVLLGLGEDGHTASLFPLHDWGTATGSPDALAVFDAPKPPPQRVSLSAARLSRARQLMFLVEGESKRDALAKWRDGADIPARAVRPACGVDVLTTTQTLTAS